jgi:Tfp pilus assembly protein PilX
VSLIMLLLITSLAVTSFRLSRGNSEIVGNMQARNLALSGAQGAVETVLSSMRFTVTPNNAVEDPCNGVANTMCLDMLGDGAPSVNVQVAVNCEAIQPISNASLDFNNAQDAGCIIGNAQNFGIDTAAAGDSMCANSVWNVRASATDIPTSANYIIDQGNTVRVPAGTDCP